MRKCRYLLLCLLLLAGLIACSNETQPVEEEKIEPPVTVTVEPSHKEEEPHLPTGSEMMTEDKEGAAAPKGGILDACGDRAAFLSQQGGIVLADLSEAGYHYLSSSTAAKLYYDGTQVYYTGDDGIFAIDAEGQTVQLSAHLSYALWVENGKIYYIRQTDLSSEKPVGELWCMNNDGSGAVIILASKIRGEFCIKDGWVYYISADDGCLYRSMLFGTQVAKLVDGPVKICFVTERGIYYKEQSGRMALRRIDLKSGANISLGAYGEIVAAGETIAIMARRENTAGYPDNQFTLMTFDDRTQEMAVQMVFENIGADSLAWLQDGYVYMFRDGGGVYRIALEDERQTKEDLFAGDTVFAEGRAWHIAGNALEVYDCATGETTAIKLG